jgi:alkylhydroperoxidase family enzyme
VDAVVDQQVGETGVSRPGLLRAGLLALGAPQLAIGAWALLLPRDWFEGFPGLGNHWLPLYGPFDEHLATDVGSTFIAVGLLLVLAAVWLERRVVQAAAVAYLAYQVPHFVYHLGADDALTAGDQVVNGVTLGLTVVVAASLLVLTREPDHPGTASEERHAGTSAGAGSPASDDSSSGSALDERRAGSSAGKAVSLRPTGRLTAPRRSLLARVANWYSRKRYGRVLSPVTAYLHHPKLLFGYGAFETAVERSHRVDERLKALGELKAATVVGCEWCMDFGSRLSLDHGVPEQQLRELPRYGESEAFTDLERAVLDYAAAMSRTPAQVDDELFARLREHLDDAQLVELTNAIAIENLRARFNHALGLDAQGFSEGAFCVIPERAAAAPGG